MAPTTESSRLHTQAPIPISKRVATLKRASKHSLDTHNKLFLALTVVHRALLDSLSNRNDANPSVTVLRTLCTRTQLQEDLASLEHLLHAIRALNLGALRADFKLTTQPASKARIAFARALSLAQTNSLSRLRVKTKTKIQI